jgi:hypothetical protein
MKSTKTNLKKNHNKNSKNKNQKKERKKAKHCGLLLSSQRNVSG